MCNVHPGLIVTNCFPLRSLDEVDGLEEWKYGAHLIEMLKCRCGEWEKMKRETRKKKPLNWKSGGMKIKMKTLNRNWIKNHIWSDIDIKIGHTFLQSLFLLSSNLIHRFKRQRIIEIVLPTTHSNRYIRALMNICYIHLCWDLNHFQFSISYLCLTIYGNNFVLYKQSQRERECVSVWMSEE